MAVPAAGSTSHEASDAAFDETGVKRELCKRAAADIIRESLQQRGCLVAAPAA